MQLCRKAARSIFRAAKISFHALQPVDQRLDLSLAHALEGFGKGAARVSLVEDGGATILRYQVDANVGGKLAQVGSRLIDGAARKMADDFFRKFGELVAPGQAETVAAPPSLTSRTIWLSVPNSSRRGTPRGRHVPGSSSNW